MGFLHLSKNLGTLLTPVDHADVPNAESGCLIVYIYNGNNQLYSKDDAGTVTQIVGSGASILYTETAGALVFNTTTLTSLFSSGIGSLTVPLALLLAGAKILVRIAGTTSSKSSSPGNLTLQINLAGASFAADTITPVPTSINGTFVWEVELSVTVAGSGGAVNLNSCLIIQPTLSGLVAPYVDIINASSPIDLSADLALDVLIQYSVANASNNTAASSGTVEYIPPA